MPYIRTPTGITPPAPGLEHEEPELVATEEDIPGNDGGAGARADAARDERPLRPERE
jgi:hypothetical protein